MDALCNQNYSNLFVSSLMDDCRCLVPQIPWTHVRHCYCEANGCADVLTHKGGCQAADFVIFDSLPVDITSFLDFDFNGLYLNRICPETLFSF